MSNSRKKSTADDEVEQLLRAAQDDMLLKLSLNSHMARASSSAAIDPDLDRRFLALKKPHNLTKTHNPEKSAAKKIDSCDSKAAASSPEDDLFARFAALKSSVPSHGGKEKNSNIPRDESVDEQVTEEDNDEDEVETVIKWAIDAARLDPSPPSDDDDNDDRDPNSDIDGDGDDNSEDDDDDDGVGRGERNKRK